MHGRKKEIPRVSPVKTVKLVFFVKVHVAKCTSEINEDNLILVLRIKAHVLQFKISMNVVKSMQSFNVVDKLKHKTIEVALIFVTERH